MLRYRHLIVWIARIVIGGVFVVSGIAKLIDPWGFVYKIDQYLAVWGMSFQRTITLVGAITIAGVEFTSGVILAMGCFRRGVVWILSAMMAVMLPLTFYIMVANPVSDCGCFGDLWTISNSATFFKNVLITVAVVYLWYNNTKVKCLFRPASQWLVCTLLWVYAIAVGFVGYNFQPMIDFRSHPVGSEYHVGLSQSQEDVDDEVGEMEFIYEREGVTRTFRADELPDDDEGWTFVDRRSAGASADVNEAQSHDVMTLYDEADEDVTDDVFTGQGEQIILLIPDLRRIDISYTLLINELYKEAAEEDVDFFAIIATDQKGIEGWRDISMAQYPCYTADDTDIKELARGNIAIVVIDDGRIIAKRNISSLDDTVTGRSVEMPQVIDEIKFDGVKLFWQLTSALVVLLLIVWALQSFVNYAMTKAKKNVKDKD